MTTPSTPAKPDSPEPADAGTIQRLERRLQRERQARHEAESLLEKKSLELYQVNGDLRHLAAELEERVADRTKELQAANQQLQAEIEARGHTQLALEEARDTAEKASRAKSIFLANMSHELRTPLNAIIGYSELVYEELSYGENTTMRDDVNHILTAGRHLLNLISDILDISKIEAGKVVLFPEPFAISELLESVQSTFLPLVARNGNQLVIEAVADIPMQTDKTKLRQVLFNLMSNAAKFTENGVISVTASPKLVEKNGTASHWITLTVQDTGIGMTPTELDHIFKPFDQADRSTTQKFGGTGLGLTINRHFCTMMGGTIDVVSSSGVGSTFIVDLPTHLPPTPSTE